MQAYTVIVHEETNEDGGGCWAEVQELPGCFASGSLDALEKDVREAIVQHISALKELGKPVPDGQSGAASERQWLIPVA